MQTVSISSGSVEYDVTEAAIEIEELIEGLVQAQEEGATHASSASPATTEARSTCASPSSPSGSERNDMTTYAPNPHYYEEGHLVYDVRDDVLTAEIEDARQHLAKAIEAKGEDYVYLHDSEVTPSGAQACLYLRYDHVNWSEVRGAYNYHGPKGPSCIVGHVLVYKEIPFDQITSVEGDNAAAALDRTKAYTSPIIREALNAAQSKQDNPNGYTWGEAVEEFEAYINERTVRTDD